MTGEEDDRGAQLTRRKFALGLAFASVAGVAAARQPTKRVDYLGKAKLDDVLPEQFGQWKFYSNSGLVVPPEDQLSRAIYSQLLTRVYSDSDGRSVMLLVAQSASQTGILQIHRPEICYTAGGYQLGGIEPHSVQLPGRTLPTVTMSARSDMRTEQLVYWTRIGEHLPTTWRQQRLAVAMDNLRGLVPDAVMVRVSTISNDKAASLALIGDFIGAMVKTVSPQVRRVLIS